MKINLPIFCTVAFTLFSCSDNQVSTQDPDPPVTFYRAQVEMSADTDKAIADHTTTIKLHCLPLLSGVGRMQLDIGKNRKETTVYVDSPLQDTVETGIAGKDITVPVKFVANQPFDQQWHIRFDTAGYYNFHARAIFDSVAIADSSRLYWVQSAIVRQSTPNGVGYTWLATSNSSLVLTP
jgi:hypothetical protein